MLSIRPSKFEPVKCIQYHICQRRGVEGNSKEFCHPCKLNPAIYFLLWILYCFLKEHLFLVQPVLYEPFPQYEYNTINITFPSSWETITKGNQSIRIYSKSKNGKIFNQPIL